MKTKESKERTHTNNKTIKAKKNFGEVRIVPGYELQLRYDFGDFYQSWGERAGGAFTSFQQPMTHKCLVWGSIFLYIYNLREALHIPD